MLLWYTKYSWYQWEDLDLLVCLLVYGQFQIVIVKRFITIQVYWHVIDDDQTTLTQLGTHTFIHYGRSYLIIWNKTYNNNTMTQMQAASKFFKPLLLIIYDDYCYYDGVDNTMCNWVIHGLFTFELLSPLLHGPHPIFISHHFFHHFYFISYFFFCFSKYNLFILEPTTIPIWYVLAFFVWNFM